MYIKEQNDIAKVYIIHKHLYYIKILHIERIYTLCTHTVSPFPATIPRITPFTFS